MSLIFGQLSLISIMVATEVITREIETDSIWEQNLGDLDAVSGFNIIETDEGNYKMEPFDL